MKALYISWYKQILDFNNVFLIIKMEFLEKRDKVSFSERKVNIKQGADEEEF